LRCEQRGEFGVHARAIRLIAPGSYTAIADPHNRARTPCVLREIRGPRTSARRCRAAGEMRIFQLLRLGLEYFVRDKRIEHI